MTGQFKAAGRSVLPNIPKHRVTTRFKLPRPSAESLRTKKLRKTLRSAINNRESKEEIRAKEEAWKKAKFKQHKHEALIYLRRKYRIRNLIAAKGKEGSRIFWNCISNKKKTSAFIDVLSDGGKLIFDPSKKAKVIENFFKTKFNTTDDPRHFNEELFSEETLGTPTKKLSDQESRKIVKEISIEELDDALDSLNARKAEGLDNITNNMLKNTSFETRQLILELFNDVLLSGVNPRDWKVGHVILLLKRAPGDDISNYRPITLISCLSKILTKILSKRITEAVETSGIAGDLQNGFRPGRNCSDNIFILNSLLELNNSKKKLSYLLFVDLQAGFGNHNSSTCRLRSIKILFGFVLSVFNHPITFLLASYIVKTFHLSLFFPLILLLFNIFFPSFSPSFFSVLLSFFNLFSPLPSFHLFPLFFCLF